MGEISRHFGRDGLSGRVLMLGLMQQQPLLISSLLTFAARHHGEAEIVSNTVEGPRHRYTYRDAERRARRLARVLERLGVRTRRPGRHAGLERLPPLRALLRRLRHGGGDPHHQPAAVRAADRAHRRPCRGPGAVRRPDLRAACRASAWAASPPSHCRGGDDRSRAHAGVGLPPGIGAPRLRGPAGRGGRGLRLARARREPGGSAVLHLGHDRPAEGRALQPPLDRPPRLRRSTCPT